MGIFQMRGIFCFLFLVAAFCVVAQGGPLRHTSFPTSGSICSRFNSETRQDAWKRCAGGTELGEAKDVPWHKELLNSDFCGTDATTYDLMGPQFGMCNNCSTREKKRI